MYHQLLIAVLCLLEWTSANVISLDGNNIEQILKDNELVFINFYADWCRFSQQLKPIFLEASNKFDSLPPGKVAWASVDADRQPDIASKYHVSKYPTLKLIRNGEVVKKEYRSQRSVEALSSYVQKQLDTSINTVANMDEVNQKLDGGKRNVLAFFPQNSGPEYDTLQKVASVLREECTFFVGFGPAFQPQTAQGPKILFRPSNSHEEVQFAGDFASYEYMKQWLSDKCTPLVREITFENAEELTEEGLPFLILFKHPDDKASEKMFTDAVIREIPDQRAAVNCLVADGKKFAHPLHHLGKQESDLPVIAIDSFRHMYLLPQYNQINEPGKLRQFILDLHSGKLHREFHHGPDPVQVTQEPHHDSNQIGETQPPPSVFEKLKPSHNRYTILDKDEL